ncbi:MAG: RNA 3'-terminal phosphate cyclase [Desulfobacterales bacterium]|nr:RNA 3'-terminal phosphate cyclase [Desulfobacterales bacterium]
MITIDGSFGEGGGQILRSALALSMITGKPFNIINIRASRKKPGLMAQHLAAVNASHKIGQAEVTGNTISSTELYFKPNGILSGSFNFDTGTAGSGTLVFQTIMPALIKASCNSNIIFKGGTHNPFAPPYDFIDKAFIPLLKRMNINISSNIERYGFYPRGGGKFSLSIQPLTKTSNLNLLERGRIKKIKALSIVSQLPISIAEREIDAALKKLKLNRNDTMIHSVKNPVGPGNAFIIEVESENITEIFTGFGERGVKAEDVADKTISEVNEYINAEVPIGENLADQLLIPMVITGGGRFLTLTPSQHTLTNIEIIKKFVDADFKLTEHSKNKWELEIKVINF